MSGGPLSGSEIWEAPDREIAKPGENRGEIIAHRKFQPAPAAFLDGENRRITRWEMGLLLGSSEGQEADQSTFGGR